MFHHTFTPISLRVSLYCTRLHCFIPAPRPHVFFFQAGPGDPLTIQETIYNKTAAPLIESVIEVWRETFVYIFCSLGVCPIFLCVLISKPPGISLQGFNGTIFAYGQTGAGKSYTMEGGDTPETEGLMPRAFRHLIDKIGLNTNKNLKYLIRASYLEVYNDKVYDLLGKNQKSWC